MSLRKSLAAGAVLAAAFAPVADAAVHNQWVQYGPGGTVLVRSISDPGDSCPSLAIDGSPVTMTPRFTPDAPATTPGVTADQTFPVLMCEASMPLGGYTAKVATVNGVNLKMPIANPQKIVVIGDTGCRVASGAYQPCNDPMQFPLAYLSSYVASFKPDMIVHTGDFYYREVMCPSNVNCTGSPYGDNWQSWNADWFTPAAVMMQSAPMALSRGNHESCDRGAHGWFKLLAVQYVGSQTGVATAANCGPQDGFASYRSSSATNPEPQPLDPNDHTPSYVVDMGAVDLIMFDYSYANDGVVQPNLIGLYDADLNSSIARLNGKPAFFVAHKPTYGLTGGVQSNGTTSPYVDVAGGNATSQTLFAGGVPAPISLLLSGHIHNFQLVDFPNNTAFAPQFVIGNSGTQLSGQYLTSVAELPAGPATYTYVNGSTGAGTSASPQVLTTANTTFQEAVEKNNFGFAVLTQTPGGAGYVADVYTLGAARAGRCTIVLNPRGMTCTAF